MFCCKWIISRILRCFGWEQENNGDETNEGVIQQNLMVVLFDDVDEPSELDIEPSVNINMDAPVRGDDVQSSTSLVEQAHPINSPPVNMPQHPVSSISPALQNNDGLGIVADTEQRHHHTSPQQVSIPTSYLDDSSQYVTPFTTASNIVQTNNIVQDYYTNQNAIGACMMLSSTRQPANCHNIGSQYPTCSFITQYNVEDIFPELMHNTTNEETKYDN